MSDQEIANGTTAEGFGIRTVDGAQILGSGMKAGRRHKVKQYDFRRPDKFSREQIMTLSLIHETASRELAGLLGALVGDRSLVHLAMVDQLTMDEFVRSSAKYDPFAVIDATPLRGGMLLRFDQGLAALLVHRVCGGSGFPDLVERNLTDLERVVLLDAAESMVPAINEGWRRVVELDCRITSIETEWRRAAIVSPNEMIVTATFEVGILGRDLGCVLAIPYITLEPVVRKLSAQSWYSTSRRSGATPAYGAAVVDLPVDAEIAIDLGRVRLADVPSLANEIRLPSREDARFVLRAGDADVAVLSTPADYLAVGPVLAIERCGDPEGARKLLAAAPGDPHRIAEEVGDRVGRRIADSLGSEISALRRAVEELTDRAPNETAGTMIDEESVSFAPAEMRDVAITLAGESPQTAAFLLAPLEPEIASGVLALLPEEMHGEVVERVYRLEGGATALHRRVVSYLSRRTALARRQRVTGGVDAVVRILGRVPRSVEKRVMEGFHDRDRPMFEEIAKRMFVFEDFVVVTREAIAKLAARIDPEEFALALRRVPVPVHEHIISGFDDAYRGLVERAASETGAVRLRDVEAAQRSIIEELRVLEESGEVVIARKDELVE
jgi:flagellar motor switch protein FliM